MIRRYEEDVDRLYLPRGAKYEAARMIETAGSKLEVVYQRQKAPVQAFTLTGQLTSGQEAAVDEMVGHDLGVLVAPNEVGKTVMDCGLIAAAGEQEKLVLLHYDSDFDLIAKVTGQQCEWVVPAGTVD